MFLGTTTVPVRNYIGAEILRLKPKVVREPCAGNFVVSHLCGAIDKGIRVISGDISSYSMAIGYGLVGKDVGIRMREKWAEEYPILAAVTDPLEIAAMVIIVLELAECRAKSDKMYYAQLERHLRTRQREALDSVLKKLKAMKEMLGDFHFDAVDAVASLKEAERGDMVFFDPPYWAGGYEKMFKRLPEWITFPEAPYTEITLELRDEILTGLTDRGCIVYTRPEKPIEVPGYDLCFEYEYKAGSRYMVYSNTKALKAQGRAVLMPEKQPSFDQIFTDTVLTADMKAQFVPIPTPLANHYRLLWTKKVNPKDMGTSWALVIGGMICGVVAIESGLKFSISYALLVSDAAPYYTRYKRLSRLVLCCVLTREFLETVNRKMVWEHDGWSTIAASNEPVSMKYRGLFDLAERKDGNDGWKYSLIYRTKEIRWKTVQTAYEEWLKRYGEETRKD
jgi:hypothetical protein